VKDTAQVDDDWAERAAAAAPPLTTELREKIRRLLATNKAYEPRPEPRCRPRGSTHTTVRAT
jgi:hypothetical protein